MPSYLVKLDYSVHAIGLFVDISFDTAEPMTDDEIFAKAQALAEKIISDPANEPILDEGILNLDEEYA